MNVELEQLRTIATGTVKILKENGGICFHRFTKEQEELFKNTEDFALLLSPAGIKLHFNTNSTKIVLKGLTEQVSKVRSFYCIDIVKDGKLLDCIKNYDELNIGPKYSEKEYETGYFSKEISLGNGFKNIEIHLPYSVKFTLYKMELDENAVIEPIKYKKKLLAYGDSITHGFDALHPSQRYTSKLCNMLNAEEYKKGIGGTKFNPLLARLHDGITPNYITVAYGTNDLWDYNQCDFRRNVRDFFQNLAKNYPAAQIFAISPIWRADMVENHTFGSFNNIGDIMAEEASKINNTVYINGTDFIPHESECFGDGFLHPNDAGFEFYSQKLYKLIVSAEDVLPRKK